MQISQTAEEEAPNLLNLELGGPAPNLLHLESQWHTPNLLPLELQQHTPNLLPLEPQRHTPNLLHLQPGEHLEQLQPFQRTSLRERRGRGGGVFGDLVVNTRQYMEHVRKSKTGSEGRMVKLFSNHFQMRSRPQTTAYKYSVNYQPDEVCGDILKISSQLFHNDTLVLCLSLIFSNVPNFRLKFNKKGMTLSRTFNKQPYLITIEFSKELQPSDPDLLRYYNILLRSLKIWCGYITSVLQYENSITLCADVIHKLIRIETAFDIIRKLVGEGEATKETQELIDKELVGSIVFTTYNNRTYRVDAVNWTECPTSKFTTSKGTEISYKDYCEQKYNTEVTDMSQPLLTSKGRWKKSLQGIAYQPVQLIPQLCQLTGLSEKIRKNNMLMRQLAEKMRHEITQTELQRWNLRFDTNFLSLQGRVLKEFVPHPQHGEWSRDVRTTHLINAKSLDHWLLLYTKRSRDAALSLERNLYQVTPTMNITMRHPVAFFNPMDSVIHLNCVLNMICISYTTVIASWGISCQLSFEVVCVLSSDKKEVYDGIKKYLCVNCPIPSQCVVARTLERPQVEKTIATKIAQQMNCKMGGALWKVDTGLKNAMFIGIDCFHDIVNRRKSIAAFVASCNEDLTQWFSQCVLQETGQELVSGLRACLQAALKHWSKYNSSLPYFIIVYRDGVGDGQLQALIDHEIPQFETALEETFKSFRFTLTFIVVKKRINTRFFIETQGKFGNPPPGTVIDIELTRKEWFDFFIISQHVKDGTVTPTHYNIIYDTYEFSPDKIQCLTYKLCHMYYNMSGIIRVPAPCHYAHKLAYLVGQSIHQEPHLSLTNRLFYL
ncbi:PREDICTED: piwi-like protein 3 [Condylura cristata]|uniref:piwi-like protein 3 n=1 Tax=Condylura cristata TaxID=143302 RepID=UPI000643A202|nr:PREDICTED: piwi-like protein 3 [Condylura cristata]